MNSWEPKDEAQWKDLIEHLDEELPDLQDALKISDDDLALIHNYNLGCKWIIKVDQDAKSAAASANGYKQEFMDGPAGTDMSTVPVPAVYAVAPTVKLADMKGAIREVRGRLSKSGSGWTTTIASFLHLAGSEDIFIEDDYKPHAKTDSKIAGLLKFKVSGIKHVDGHNFYVRVVGAASYDKPIYFSGAKFDAARVSTPATEALEVFAKGVIKNKEIGIASDVMLVTFKNLPPVTP